MASETQDPPHDLSRRDLFKTVGAGAAAAVAGAPLESRTAVAQARQAAASQLEALETLTATEADILEAVCARLIPTDENGPGAAEARAAHYIDRALTGPLRASRDAYAAEHGYDLDRIYADLKLREASSHLRRAKARPLARA